MGDAMEAQMAQYQEMLERARLAFNVDITPKVYLTLTEARTDCTIRYLVHARQRRGRASDLILAISVEMSEPQHQGRIVPAYPRTVVDATIRQGQGDIAS